MFGKAWDVVSLKRGDCPGWFQSPCAGNMFGKRRGTHVKNGSRSRRPFQSPCAGNMFGKTAVDARKNRRLPVGERFQSPCAGNMFGKPSTIFVRRSRSSARGFQSPCAGNMFGKTLGATCSIELYASDRFQSPCAGNMFGKFFRHADPSI